MGTLLVYLIAGMIYAGLMFKFTIASLYVSGSSDDELRELLRTKQVDKEKAAATLLIALVITLIKIPLFPLAIIFDFYFASASKEKIKRAERQ
ncbi:hypothetical protein [Bacillus amyloliquefaciens]|uniref:hypothetical protein n=1 Tax=Bacillus amyloliquefaciens TaxID=1390 RepID=UPI000B445219|nr:hypothetical protein [Bacillus amyloliquefaciens]ARW40239.1 hypothetical protein S101267_03179 [Bacillus amyloliquefaciens]